ncbi:MAG: hypothetical protein Q7J47_04470 [Azoarcus sp.]|nr:hypothetical protein [Azoarcus sp.]
MNKLKLVALSAALCFGMATSAIGANMTKTEHQAAADAISAKYKADKEACKSLSGNAEDICEEQAKGHEAVSKAELEANYKPSDKSRINVSMVRAEAAYAVAKEKCDDFAGNAKDVCVKEAEATFVAAKEDAKLAEKTAEANAIAREKTGDANATARETNTEARKDAASEKREANYATAKEKCDAFAGEAKDSCLAAAKSRYAQ